MASPARFGSFEAAIARTSLKEVVNALRKKIDVLALTLARAARHPFVTEYEHILFLKSLKRISNELASLLVENSSDSSLVSMKAELSVLQGRIAELKVQDLTSFQRMKIKVHSLCNTAAHTSRDLLSTLETSRGDPLVLSRTFESSHRKLAQLQTLQMHILSLDDSDESLTESQRKELCSDLGRHIHLLSNALIGLVRTMAQNRNELLAHFEIPQDLPNPSRISCAICGDAIGRLCDKCDSLFEEQLKLLNLNSHGIAHSNQIIEILKSQNSEAIEKQSSRLQEISKERQERETLANSIQNLKDEESKHQIDTKEARKRIQDLKEQIEELKHQNSLIRFRVSGQEVEFRDLEENAPNLRSNVGIMKREKARRLLAMAGVEQDHFDPKYFYVFGMRIPKNLQLIRNIPSDANTNALALLSSITDALAKLFNVILPHRLGFNSNQLEVLPSLFEDPSEILAKSASSRLFTKAIGILPGSPRKLQILDSPQIHLIDAIDQNFRCVAAQVVTDVGEEKIQQTSVGELILSVMESNDPNSNSRIRSSSHVENDVDFVVIEEYLGGDQ